jgi:hypothetical protein
MVLQVSVRSPALSPALWAICLGAISPSLALSAGDAVPNSAGAATVQAASQAEREAEIADDRARGAEQVAKEATKSAATAEKKAESAADKADQAQKGVADATKRAEEAATKAEEAAKQAAKAEAKASEAIPEAREEAREEARRVSAVAVPSNRMAHVVGAYLSVWGDPYPTTIGANIAYHVYDFVRVNLGFGSDDADVFRAATAGVGAKLFVPGWNLSPVLGLNLSFTKRTDNRRPRTVRGFDPSGAHGYTNFGLDWVTGLGFNFGVGYVQPLYAGVGGSYYLNAGVFL